MGSDSGMETSNDGQKCIPCENIKNEPSWLASKKCHSSSFLSTFHHVDFFSRRHVILKLTFFVLFISFIVLYIIFKTYRKCVRVKNVKQIEMQSFKLTKRQDSLDENEQVSRNETQIEMQSFKLTKRQDSLD